MNTNVPQFSFFFLHLSLSFISVTFLLFVLFFSFFFLFYDIYKRPPQPVLKLDEMIDMLDICSLYVHNADADDDRGFTGIRRREKFILYVSKFSRLYLVSSWPNISIVVVSSKNEEKQLRV